MSATNPEPGVTISIVKRNMAEVAREEVDAARALGEDPWALYRGHLSIARAMKDILEQEHSTVLRKEK